ncbi:flavin-containing monooxygenase [Patulibacter minatonensis]|uniref:flavin-containing monooxygenase n=1 Tax=Patulibacter minatonensis TaxID=298163 RepID=UPI00047A15B7|nr:NAD(P)/FAD-dependent oxidoreductase [Patulibacter minatonensis]
MTSPYDTDLDVAIIGAGFAGLYALQHLRGLGLRCALLEAGEDVGGTWFWNTYPGARVDVESLEYSYSFDDDLQQDWVWSERYAGQPEVHAYLRHVADRFDLRRDIRFLTTVQRLDLDGDRWRVTTDRDALTARFVVGAVGFLSAAYLPAIPGLREGAFDGPVVHSGRWPKDGLEVAGRRVAIIGTGASGVQLVPRIAETCAHLDVFQRSPHWCVPLQNGPMPDGYQEMVKANYGRIRELEKVAFGGFTLIAHEIADPPPPSAYPASNSALAADPEEREREYEFRWASGGLSFYLSYTDLLFDEDANATLREFFERKIRAQVDDPAVADLLIPTDHCIMAKRLCGETGYYRAFNRENVDLVDVRENAIAEITADGVRLADGTEHPADVLVCATGYDAGSGPMLRIPTQGRDGSLQDHWAEGTRTHLGVMAHGFPNLFIVDGAQSPAAFYCPPLLVQHQSRWIGRTIQQVDERGARTVEPTPEAVAEWGAIVAAIGQATLLPTAVSQYMGANIPGKPVECLSFLGGFGEYARRTELALDLDEGQFVLDGTAATEVPA